jgi:hypothetical protein
VFVAAGSVVIAAGSPNTTTIINSSILTGVGMGAFGMSMS